MRCTDWRVALLALAVVGAPASLLAAPPAVFTDDLADVKRWAARPGIKCEAVDADGRPGRALRVTGKQDPGWNYVASSTFELRPGSKHRLTAWVLVRRGDAGHPPFFKIEFMARRADGKWDGGQDLGRVRSTSYDPRKGGWQELRSEFECPPGAAGGWIALEKGADAPLEIDAFIAEVRVVEIADFTPVTYPFDKPPPALEAVKNTHPRLYLTAAQFADLKGNVQAEPYATLRREVLAVADEGVKRGAPRYIERDSYSGDEQLWQRGVGNMMPHLAMAYRLTGERQYLDAAAAYITASAGYKTWGLGAIDGRDLAAGHQLYGLALAYDWLYHDLPEQARAAGRQCLQQRGRYMFEQLHAGKVWWQRAYLQNHQWVNMAGLAAAGLALYGDVPNVDGWMRLPLEKFKTTVASLGPDGTSHEGVPYWTYGVEYMLKFMELARQLLGEDLYKDSAWWRNTAAFRLHSTLPRQGWTRAATLMTFGDGPRRDYYGPDYLLRRLAAEYRDGAAQWLADELDQADLCSAEARFLNLIWFDPTVKPAPPSDQPLLKHFEDLGLVFLRSGWDGRESLLAFKCGPVIGHHGLKRFDYDPGGGHVHPDSGALQLFAHGDWLLVDDGYSFKRTAYQNTALVNGVGQTGEGRMWFNATPLIQQKRGPRIVRAERTREFDLVSGEVAPAYEPQAGLTRFDRHIVYVRPDCWILIDDLAAKEPSEFALHFHADHPFAPAGDKAFAVRGPKGSLRLTALAPDDVAGKPFKQDIQEREGRAARTLEALTLSNPTQRDRAVFITALVAHDSAEKPAVEVQCETMPGMWVLSVKSAQGTLRLGVVLHSTDVTAPPVSVLR